MRKLVGKTSTIPNAATVMQNKYIVWLVKHASLLGLFCFILVFRLWFGMAHDAFGQDVTRDLYLAQSWREQGTWVVPYGPKASVGNFYLPPLYYQLHIWLSAISADNPHTMKFFVIVFESLTPLVLFGVLRHMQVTKRSALVLAAAYGVAALPTNFGIFAWNPNTIPFLALLGLLLWLEFLQHKKGWLLLVYPLTVTTAISFHYQAVVLVPFTLIVCITTAVAFRKQLSWLVAGLLIASLPFLPYVLHEFGHDWANTNAIVKYFTNEHSQYYDRVSKPAYLFTFFPEFIEKVVVGKETPRHWFGYVVYYFGLTSFALMLFKRNARGSRWIALYLLCLLLMFRVYKGDKLEYYMSTLFVLPSLLLGMLSLKSRRIALSLALVGVVFGAINLSKQTPEAGISQLFAITDYIAIEALDSPVRLFFHNDDHVNSLAYAFAKRSSVVVDQTSTLLVEVCDPQRPCRWNELPRCSESRPFTYAALLKQIHGYTILAEHTFEPRFTIVIGKLGGNGIETEGAKTDLLQNYKPHLYDEKFGTDLVKREWVEN